MFSPICLMYWEREKFTQALHYRSYMSCTLIVPRNFLLPPSSKFVMACGCFHNYNEHQTCGTLIYRRETMRILLLPNYDTRTHTHTHTHTCKTMRALNFDR